MTWLFLTCRRSGLRRDLPPILQYARDDSPPCNALVAFLKYVLDSDEKPAYNPVKIAYCLNDALCLKLGESIVGAFNLFLSARRSTKEEPSPVILEAFSSYLQAADPAVPASRVLVRWLWERLTFPPQSNVDKVLRHEISIECLDSISEGVDSASGADLSRLPRYSFVTSTESGRNLLKSLYQYAMSYEQQKWSRWVHCVKASDFNDSAGKQ